MNDTFPGFRPFAMEVNQIAGWHDGVSVNLTDPGNPHVVLHEDVHADILRNSPDGQLLSLCILFNTVNSEEEQTLNNDLISNHINEIRTAHECFATFIGANLFENKSKRMAAYKELSSEYQGYYNRLKAIASSFCKSAFFQIGLSSAIQQVVFSSPAFYEWSNNEFDYRILNSFSSTQRLFNFQKWWESIGLNESRKFIDHLIVSDSEVRSWAKQLGMENINFDLIDDDDRILLDKSFARYIENQFIQGLIEMFKSKIPMDFISFENWAKALDQTAVEAETRNIPLTIDPGFEAFRSSEYRIIDMMNSKIYIDPVSKSKLIDRRGKNFDDLSHFLRSQDYIVSLIIDTDEDGNPVWKVDVGRILWDERKENPIVDFYDCYLCDFDTISQTFMEHIQAVNKGLEHLNPGCVITTNASEEDLKNFHDGEVKDRNYCRYMESDMYDFILKNGASYQFGFQMFEAISLPIMTAVWGEPKSPDLPYVFKCIPEEYGRIIITHLYQNTNIDLAEDGSVPPAIAEALRLITRYWSII